MNSFRVAPVMFVFLLVMLLTCSRSFAQIKYQYEAEGIQVSIPSADEPKVAQFGEASLLAAAKYVEDGAVSWARGRACVNCHTTGPYLVERTAWISQFGPASQEVFETFRKDVPEEIVAVKELERKGHRHYPGAFSSVWRSLALAEWDRNVTKETSQWTDRSLRDMFQRQSDSGAFVSHGEVEIPHITTDFELSLQAIRAVKVAPNWLNSLKANPELLAKVEKLRQWLKTAPPKNDFDRVLKLQLASIDTELVSPSDRDAAIEILTLKQHDDGGWSTRDMSALEDWHFEMSDYVVTLIKGLPDADNPQSDPYMTALAIVLLRQAEIPVTDKRIQAGLNWLRQEQRESGRWWMHSLYRGNYHYTTYIATIEALKAFELCGELTVAKR
jgi:squalene-hopene/tetraprenyl-beta-curcumene cyclase